MLASGAMIAELGQIELYAWALCFALQCTLVVLLISRRNHLQFPAFTLYLAGSVAQNILQFAAYEHWGFASRPALEFAWGLQTAIILLRAMAVLEICRQVFANYRGIWAFIWRTMVISVALIATFSMVLGNRDLGYRILYADRTISLVLAFTVVALLVFARYYRVQAEDPIRSLAIGFFLYSCFEVLNDTLLEASPKSYAPMWNFLGTVSFTSSVLVWGWALRRSAAQIAEAPEMLASSVYQALSPEVNRRLSALNERLGRLSERPERKP
jgi:hypothetical protein